MTKLIAALILSVFLVVGVYVAFWWGSAFFYGNQMRAAVERVLGGELSYTKPELIPDLQLLKISLSNVRMVLRDSPVLEVRARKVVLSSGLFSRNQWVLDLPSRLEVVMASGEMFLLDTRNGRLVWNVDPVQMSLRADELDVLSVDQRQLAHIKDVMMERRPTDEGIRINLASRPDFGDGASVLSGQLVVPPRVMNDLMEAFGRLRSPDLPTMARVAALSLADNHGTLVMDNISFLHNNMGGAVYGALQVNADGQLLGEAAMTADNPARLLGWIGLINQSGLRDAREKAGWQSVIANLDPRRPAARLEVIPNGLLVNGFMVGPVPQADDVIGAIWR